MRKLLLGGVVLGALGALIAPPALAADMAVKAPPPVPVWTWTGCYIGVNAGVVWDRTHYYNVQPNTIGFGQGLGAFNPAAAPQYAVGLSNDLTNTGFTGGGQIGCNYQFQTAVFGWESDFQYTGIDKTFTASLTTVAPATAYTVTQSFNSHWLNTNRARFGFAFSSSWMFYATGGFAVANVSYSDTFIVTANGGTVTGVPFVGTVSQTRVGYTVGAGFEWMISPNVSFKAEYLYVDLGKTSYTATAINPALPLAFFTVDHRLTESLFRVGLNYRFNGGPGVGRY